MFWQIEELKLPCFIPKQRIKKTYISKQTVKTTNEDIPLILNLFKRRDINTIFKIESSPSQKEWQSFVKSDIKYFYKNIFYLDSMKTFQMSIKKDKPTGVMINYVKYNNQNTLVIMNDLNIFKIINNNIIEVKNEVIDRYINNIHGLQKYKSEMIREILSNNSINNFKLPKKLGTEYFGDLTLDGVNINIFPLTKVHGTLTFKNSVVNYVKCKYKHLIFNINDSKINIF